MVSKKLMARKYFLPIFFLLAMALFSHLVLAFSTTTNLFFNVGVLDFVAPNTTLESPPDNYYTGTSYLMNFNCSATDDLGLKSINLYLTNAQNQSFGLNRTTMVSGTANSANWTLNLLNGNYTWNCLTYDLGDNSDWGDSNRSLSINYSLPKMDIKLDLNDNKSIDLNWTDIPGADYYNLYYSSNISAIMTLNLSNIATGVYNFSNISDSNYTDATASDVQKRYYVVSYVIDGVEQLTTYQTVGKYTFYYDVLNSSIYGTLASNRMGIYFDVNFTAESFLQQIPGYLNPTISKQDKSDGSGEYLTTHIRGLEDGNDFAMAPGEGYLVTLDEAYNQTVVGAVYDPSYTLYYTALNSTVYGTLASNWVTVYDFKKNYTAESFLQEIPGYLNPTMSRLDKSDGSGEFLTTHIRGLNDGNDFVMEIGVSYIVTVDDYYNQTLCTTDCFS